MSYDLYLRPRRGSLSHDRFREYFAGRLHYTVQGDGAAYENPDTGIYFTFDYERPGAYDDPDEPAELRACPLAFNINYMRPSCFAREAEPELTALVRGLDLVVHDPQIDGMGDGDYDPAVFLSNWDVGNRMACTGAFARQFPPKHTLPAAEIMRVWRWNHGRRKYQESLTEDLFVASVYYVLVDGVVHTATIWTDGIPSILPRVDYVLAHRDECAPGALLWKQKDAPRVPWSDIEPLILRHATVLDGPSYRTTYTRAPRELLEFVKRLPAWPLKHESVSQDRVLDAELVAPGAVG